jgi:hypothetical protein
LFDSLGVRGRYLLGCGFHNILNADRAGETVEGTSDQHILTQETAGFLLVVDVVPDIVVIVFQYKPNRVLGDNSSAERLKLGLCLRNRLLRAIGLPPVRRLQDAAKQNR